jgi:very-short-patch-repair endonuclease
MSLPEVQLWRELRKRPGGYKFRRQHPAGQYLLDFYCAALRLAIEVDGFAHASSAASRRDKRRSEWLRSQQIATKRIPARMIFEDIEAVVTRIVEICRLREKRISQMRPVPLHHPADGPPPQNGEN